jgi:hypothetical protein
VRRFYLLCPLLCLLAAACGDASADLDRELAARRAALGLGNEPLSFADAMTWMRKRTMEGLLARVGSRRLRRDDVLDTALRLENVLARTEPASAGRHRAADPGGFDRLLRRSREQAGALARAMASGADGRDEAATLLTTCVECHLEHRQGP